MTLYCNISCCVVSPNLFVFFIGKKADGNEDDIPSSAVDLQVKERVCVYCIMNLTFINCYKNGALFVQMDGMGT